MAYRDMTIEVNSTTPQQPFQRHLVGFPPGSVLISVEDNDIRFWYGGTDPTKDSGHKLVVGAFYRASNGVEIENLKIVATFGTARVNASVGGT